MDTHIAQLECEVNRTRYRSDPISDQFNLLPTRALHIWDLPSLTYLCVLRYGRC